MEQPMIVLPRPDDWHVHLRQGPVVADYARVHHAAFGRILAMPNTIPPLTKVGAIREYRRSAEEAAPGLTVHTAFRLMPTMTAEDIGFLADAGILAGKYYPDGATTNSAGGLTDWKQISQVLAAMEERGLVLCVHGEDPEAPVFDREEAFLPTFMDIRRAFPRLKMVFEHVSSAAGVAMVLRDQGPTAATVTVQHLMFSIEDLLGGLLKPQLFCKPVVKTQADRRAIEKVVLGGHPKFFFGSDSAPHDAAAKHSEACPAGSYTAPIILPALATFFERAGALDRLEPFLCRFGRDFYGVAPNSGTVELRRTKWRVPDLSEGCVPLMAGEVLPWCVVST